MSNQHNLLLPSILVAVFQSNTFLQAALGGKYQLAAQNRT